MKKKNAFKDELPTRPATPSVLPKPVKVEAPKVSKPVIDIPSFRLAASMLLTYAVDGSGKGARSTSDPVYRLIVEGRLAPKYSSCGDLAHWLYFRLGVRAPWINRAEFREPDGHGWRVGLNLNLLVPWPVGSNTIAVKPSKLVEMPDIQPGDLLQISNVFGGHQVCVAGRSGDTIVTAEYGQPGGAKKHRGLKLSGGSLFLTDAKGANQVISWISLPKALELPGNVGPDLQALTDAQRETLGKGLPGFSMRP